MWNNKWGRAISALASDRRLDYVDILKTNVQISVLLILAGSLVLSFQQKGIIATDSTLATVPYWQITIGLLQLGLAGMPYVIGRSRSGCVVLQGFALACLIVAYIILIHIVTGQGMTAMGVHRVGHLPGILSIGTAYSIRQIVDYGGKKIPSALAGKLGFILGGLADAYVVIRIMLMSLYQ